MGLPMDNLHAPTVASGASSSGHGSDKKQLSVQELIAEKDKVWSELTALGAVLDSHGVNMNTSLTTFDGYPRPDIDVAQIRTTRARIIRLKNDYKALMARIEAALQEHWSNPAAPASTTIGSAGSSSSTQPNTPAVVEVPFAKVNSVVSSSPADTAGLKVGDKITKFGGVDWRNHEKLSRVAQTVQQSEGSAITIKVIRPAVVGGGDERLEMQLTPRHNWGGRGMLGCHLLPL
ncbi:hypothetical protein AAFC00_000346 [Neodothiora populina]|uniref:PDZ domain-containing protein n=1 Tax=Neodothiora populina TaxID=2781224 RepID=A0ABR3PCV6_9PEZI